MEKPKRIICLTGNHHSPAIELINQLQHDPKYDWKIHYIGRQYSSYVTKTLPVEKDLIPKLGVYYYEINPGKLDRKYFPNTLNGLPLTIGSFFKSLRFIDLIRPDIIVSFGGNISVPVIIAGWLKKIPSITHEQTLTNSLSTKINSFFVTKIALSFNNPDQLKELPPKKIVITGNLLRSAIFNHQGDQLPHLFKNQKPLLYITAGNQGSQSLNQQILAILPKLISDFNIIHQTGTLDYQSIANHTQKFISSYYPVDFVGLQDIGWVLNHAAVIISRAGANTSQEIVALDKKSILIPLPFAQQNEQLLNALWVQKNLPQKTIIIKQSDLTPELIQNSVISLNKYKSAEVKSYSSDSNLRLLNLIHEIV